MPSSGFESVTPATKRPQTYALDRAATEVGIAIPNTLIYSELRVRLYLISLRKLIMAKYLPSLIPLCILHAKLQLHRAKDIIPLQMILSVCHLPQLCWNSSRICPRKTWPFLWQLIVIIWQLRHLSTERGFTFIMRAQVKWPYS